MGWSDEDAFRIAILCVHLMRGVGPSNSCTADADFLLGKRGHGHGLRGTWVMHLVVVTISEAILITFDLSLSSTTLSPSFSLSQSDILCIPL
jgi:hypothetical protein